MVGDLLKTRRNAGKEGEKEGGEEDAQRQRTRTDSRRTDQSFCHPSARLTAPESSSSPVALQGGGQALAHSLCRPFPICPLALGDLNQQGVLSLLRV